MQLSKYASEILPYDFLKKYETKEVPWGFGGLGYIVFKRTYARKIKLENGFERTEEWAETVARCINAAQYQCDAKYTAEEAQQLYDLVFNLKCNFAGRMLWSLGTTTVDNIGANSLLNCWYTSIKTPDDFCFLFNQLMLGGGVGFSVKKEDIHELPKVKKNVTVKHENTKDADFIVSDSREGWVKLLKETLNAFFITGNSFSYSTILVRGKGEPISGFGGTSSGPIALIEGIEKISNLIKEREGKKLRSIDVLDIANIIGSVVVAGNVRRSAEIALGDPDDYHFIRAKRWDAGNIPNWRAMSNNTICADSFEQISNQIWEGYEGNGEPYGFFNLPLSRKMGRLGEPLKDDCEGVNPCAEITLADKECCNLSEIYLNNITSKEELISCATLLYKIQKAICAMPFIHKETNDIVHKHMRIGVGITGICQSLDKLKWLPDAYKALRKFDISWSKERGYPQSIRLTTTKPSGTLSLLAGSTPGVHPGYSQYYIRRVRMASDDKLIATCKDAGYPVEYVKNFDGTEDHNTCSVSFPCSYGPGTILTKDMKAVDQLELVKKIQTLWSDNSVSVTVYYKKEELPEIKQWLKDNYHNSLKTVSFLLHSEHGFAQAPYEEIDEKQYKKMISKIKILEIGSVSVGDDLESMECSTGICPIK